MTAVRSGCCGGRSSRASMRKVKVPKLPKNPRVSGGIELVYVGANVRHVKAAVTGLVYHVAAGARFVRVDRRDVDGLLANGAFVRR